MCSYDCTHKRVTYCDKYKPHTRQATSNTRLLCGCRYLSRLLLLHGRWSFLRNREVVLYSFYKNWAYVMVYVYLQFVAGKAFPHLIHSVGAPAVAAHAVHQSKAF